MKIHILNDLHIEFADFVLPETDADVLILAGDISVGLGGLEWLERQNFKKPVIYVPGNHEFYRHDFSLINEMNNHALPNVHVLNNSFVKINGVRFLGCTLWTDFGFFGEAGKFFAMQNASSSMADFSRIKYKGRTFSPNDAIELHTYSRNWLKCMLEENFDGKTVVVTHHAPSSGSVHPRYANDLLTAAFVSNLEDLMDGNRIALWVHGHMHDAFDYDVYGTRVICNPRGYVPYETETGFIPDLTLEI